jgi:hypothetical protein
MYCLAHLVSETATECFAIRDLEAIIIIWHEFLAAGTRYKVIPIVIAALAKLLKVRALKELFEELQGDDLIADLTKSQNNLVCAEANKLMLQLNQNDVLFQPRYQQMGLLQESKYFDDEKYD